MKPPQAPLPPGQMAISARMESEDWALLLLLSLLWGGSFFLISIALTGLPVLTIVALRLLVAALVLWAIVAATGRRLPRDPAIWRAFLVMGVLNNHSIAWGIAQQLAEAGAELAFTYQGERLKDNVKQLAETFGKDTLITECDVTQDDHIDRVFKEVGDKFGGGLDLMLHSVAFAPKEALEGDFVSTTREAFRVAHDVSAYSLVALSRAAAPLMTEGGSIVAMSYYGAAKVVPHYNVMGVAKAALETSVKYLANDLGPQNIRVNAISAGPIKTLAASGIGDFRYILKWNEYNSPLRRNVTIEDVGGAGLYFLSDLSSGVTGEVHHVDAGYHTVGMKQADAPDIALD